VKVIDSTGHGLELPVDAAPPPAAAPPRSGATLALRPLVGVALIAALFGALLAWHRRRGRR
jgi:nickel transport protein